jgi:hypothetical protein
MQPPLPARRQAQPTGVIETLSAGYAALNRHLWVLILPVVVDLLLWLGPHVSVSPLVDPAVTHATEWTRQVALGPRRSARNVQMATGLEDTRQWLIGHADDLNALDLLVWSPLGLPSAAPDAGTTGELRFVTAWPQGLGILGASLAGGLLLGAWFYGGLAAASTGARLDPLRAGRRAPRAVLRVLGLVGALLGVGLLLGLPVVLLVAFTALVSPPVAVLGSLLLGVALVFAALHLFFAVPAIVVSNVGPLAAIQRSVGLVRRHRWSSLALIGLTWLILAGMARVWDLLAGSLVAPYGTALGIVGNAYIASGLIAAGMIFYSERVQAVEHS